MFICSSSSFFAWYAQPPMALWIHSPSSTGALQECQQASFKAHKNVDKLRIFVKNLLVGDWPILCGRERAFQGPPRTSQRIAAHQSLTAKFFFKDPKVPLAAELGSWPWRLQEQAHGASARAPSRWGAQSGRWQRPCQLDEVELDSSNKAEAAGRVEAISKPTSIPTLGMSLPRLPFLKEQAVPLRRPKFFCCEREMGPREKTCKNKISFYQTSTYVVGNMPSTDVLQNESEWIILLIAWNAIGQEIPANFVVK